MTRVVDRPHRDQVRGQQVVREKAQLARVCVEGGGGGGGSSGSYV